MWLVIKIVLKWYQINRRKTEREMLVENWKFLIDFTNLWEAEKENISYELEKKCSCFCFFMYFTFLKTYAYVSSFQELIE